MSDPRTIPDEIPEEMVEAFARGSYEGAVAASQGRRDPCGVLSEQGYIRGGIAAVWPLIERHIRAQIADEIRALAATGNYNAGEYGSHRNILDLADDLADDLARGDR